MSLVVLHMRSGAVRNRSGRWAFLIFGVALLLLLGGCGSSGTGHQPRLVHDDGSGPLSAQSGGGENVLYAPAVVPWTGSFGFRLCAEHSGDRPEIEGVRYKADVVPLSIDTWIRTVEVLKDAKFRVEGIGAVRGSPPDFNEPHASSSGIHVGTWRKGVKGTVVTERCHDLQKFGSRIEYQEMVIAMKAGPGGARVTDTYVDYLDRKRPYTLHIRWRSGLCGSNSELSQDCSGS